jgi:hypothetical protein
LRNGFRIFDFEGTEPSVEDEDIVSFSEKLYNFNKTITTLILICMANSFFILQCFGNYAHVKPAAILQLTYSFFILIYATIRGSYNWQIYLVMLVAIFTITVLTVFVCFNNLGLSTDVFHSLNKIKEGENDFKNIFENLHEPIIIFEQEKPKFANETFLKRFKALIMSSDLRTSSNTCPRKKWCLCFSQKQRKEFKQESTFYELKFLKLKDQNNSLFSLFEILELERSFV